MIAKTTTGDDFEGAIAYGAGLRAGRENKKAELLSINNVVSRDPHRLAAEMKAVAALSPRCKKPVLHTSLSWAPGEEVSREQMLKAAAMYCELMGASLARHQVAVYEHRDKPHAHVHIYINRVPIDGGPALHLSQNYARNVKACRQISEELGMTPVPKRRQSVNDHSQRRTGARTFVRDQLQAALADTAVRDLAQLTARLSAQGVQAEFKHDSRGILVGASFRHNETAVKGTEVGYKAQQLREHFGLPAPAARELRPRQTAGDRTPGGRGEVVRAGHELRTDTGGPGAPSANSDEGNGQPAGGGRGPDTSVGPDDAERNENQLKRKRKRRQRPKL